MGASFIITFRETLEAALIVGIVLAYLSKTLNLGHKKFVWWGVFAGVALSVLFAFIFEIYFGGFEGRAEEIYEGIMMIIASGLLTWMILWMLKQRHFIRKNVEAKVQGHIEENYPMGLFFLVLVAVLREGIETVIFLQGARLQAAQDGMGILWGSVTGIVVAIILGYVLFKGVAKVSLGKFFTFTSVLLILFAAGLLAHGVHEFQEAGILPVYIEHLWDTNNLVDENGSFGSILKGLFGYNGNPSLLEVISYWLYLAVSAVTWRMIGHFS